MATAMLACALAASALLLLAAWCDLATRTIPDGVSIALAALGLLMRVAEGPIAAMVSLLLAAVLFAAFLPLHARGAIGGGDVKLITALAIGLSPPATARFPSHHGDGRRRARPALPLPAPSSAALAVLVPQPQAWPPRRILALERRRVSRRGPLPYAVAIAAGGILTLMKPFGG